MRTELTIEAMDQVNGGDKPDVGFDSAKEKAGQLWDDAKGYATELGQRALGTAVLNVTSAWEKIKRWF